METQERAAVLTGKEGAEIEVTVASDWTKNHRHRNPGGVVSQFFGREILERILQQPDCVGLRIYYANSKPLSGWQRFVKRSLPKDEGEVHLVLAGVTSDGTDQIPASGPKLEAFALQSNAASAATILGEQSVPCPGGVGCPNNVLTGGA
jgi:hypothetical protein